MRLTLVLLKESHRWRFKMLWREKGLVHPLTTRMPAFVKEQVDKGAVKIYTAEEIMKQERTFPPWEPAVKDDPQVMPPKTFKDHVDYHEDWIYEYGARVRFIEGEKQALILTRTRPFYELPSGVKSLVGTVTLPDQDLLMQRIIMQSNIWDPTKQMLPRRINTKLPGWKFKAEFGIPDQRIASTVVRNVAQLCAMAVPEVLKDRLMVFDPYLYTFFHFEGKQIAIKAQNELMLCSRRVLPPFANEDMVDASTAFQLPDIFPLLPTIDLFKQHVWRIENEPGWAEGYSHPNTHTLYVTYNDRWSTSQRNAKALMYCFGQTSAIAKRLYGQEVKILPQPISMNCVLTNGIQFSLVSFQLNTLDVGGSGTGIKNLVWFDSDNAMYNKILPQRAMLRNTKYEDYDPDVLKKLFALYAYGKIIQ